MLLWLDTTEVDSVNKFSVFYRKRERLEGKSSYSTIQQVLLLP